MKIPAIVLAFVVASLSLAQPAVAADSKDAPRAREATKRGKAAYNLGSYEEAAKHFEEAYRLVQVPALLFNIGQSWRLSGNPEKALVAYKSFLRTSGPDEPNRDLAQKKIEEIESELAARKGSAVPPPTPTPLPKTPESTPPPTVVSSGALASGTSPPQPELGQTTQDESATSIVESPWLWAGAGVVVLGAILAVVLISNQDTNYRPIDGEVRF